MSFGSLLPISEGPCFLHRPSQEVQGQCHYDPSKRRSGLTNQEA